MFSFTKIVTFATLAFGAIASVSAMPHPASIEEAKRQSISIDTILADLTTGLQPHADKLNALDANTATSETITPIVSDMTNMVQSAVTQIQALPLQDGVSTSDASTSIANVFKTALGPAEKFDNIPGVDKDTYHNSFLPLASVLANLLETVAGLVLVVKATLNTLLGGLAVVIVHLNLTPLLNALGL
ncbi:hypothetical protein EW146_g2785 [Bondarzewia mesenterica]|uniref:Uncharacterized protein n=1 Tax=Bondarzewia mesenterica TaxID=1095465 RepID=A0A4S4LZL5_9AGAM|nr:hypothetical protein EW146_g2785 [Bondarzewia mesenterica]